MTKRARAVLAGIGMSLAGGGVLAQEGPAKEASPAAAPGAADQPLAGPRVQEKRAEPTLVERDMAGKIRRLEVPPGEAALGLLHLDEETAQRTRTILDERAAILDRIVTDNLDLIIRIHAAGEAGDKAEALTLLGQALQKLKPLRERGTLESELGAALPEAQRAAFWALVKEYQGAMIGELRDEARARGEEARPLAATIKSSLIVLGAEVKRSYERQVGGKAAEFEKILAKLGLTPEQESRVRGLVARFAEQSKGKPTEGQKRDLFLAVMSHLNREQQKLLIRYTLGGESPG
jgi:hypothetical protein